MYIKVTELPDALLPPPRLSILINPHLLFHLPSPSPPIQPPIYRSQSSLDIRE